MAKDYRLLPRCRACLMRERGLCPACRKLRLIRSLVYESHALTLFDRWFWLGAVAHVLTCRESSHAACPVD